MSSILTALKKLENDSTREKVIQPALWRRAKWRRAHTSGEIPYIYKGLIFIFTIIVVVIITRWLTINHLSNSLPPVKTPVEEIKNREVKKPSVSTTDQSITTRPSNLPIPEQQIPLQEEKASPVSPLQPMVRNTMPQTSVLPSPKEANPTDKPLQSEVTDPKAAPDGIAEWENSDRLSLQAIAWSTIPEKRMAVINNQIVREGNLIDGIKVIEIHEDQVVINEKKRLYKLIFR